MLSLDKVVFGELGARYKESFDNTMRPFRDFFRVFWNDMND